ncbi:hypothetical protein MW887_009046 [Aspergillus wentii]|nr:hypothetical protein MW887_009046 [Aspergillus wentii]
MRRSGSTTTAEIPLPITYTPTTHRISKAKKGKRVHACEFPGCNKVFTRAEHRRRHELNHNPEALFRCTNRGCKKAFHRPDLLARHMERHVLEAQMDNTVQWEQQHHHHMVSEPHHITKYAPVSPAPSYLPTTQQNTMSIGSIVAPGIHPDLANDCYMWNGMDMPLQPRTPIFQHHIQDSTEENHFYSSPEACPSPSSDGATFSLASYPRSSVSSTPATTIEHYPENILDNDLTSSPLPTHANLRCWGPDANLVSIPLQEDLLHHPQPIHYPSPNWAPADHQSYDDQTLPSIEQFQAPMGWKAWTL